MNNKPIGVFDSGLGGLTVVRELNKVLPKENIIYFGDTGRVPYGTRSTRTIQKYAQQDIRFLTNMDVKMVIAACGTVSSVATDIVESLELPSTGVVMPAARAAALQTKNGKIGVIGTSATIESRAFEKEIALINPKAEVYGQACPLFVQLVENGWIAPDDEVTTLVAERYLAPLIAQGVDTLILGCTHFPILAPVIAKVMGREVTLIDTGREAAHHALELLLREDLLNTDVGAAGKTQFFVSDKVQGFSRLAGIFLGKDVDDDVSHVDIGSLNEKEVTPC